jgi:hypothetical protein
VSDTPRTDAAVRDVDVAFVGHWGLSSEPQEFVSPEFTRELERENAALREACKPVAVPGLHGLVTWYADAQQLGEAFQREREKCLRFEEVMQSQGDEIRRLTAENDALREDKERLDWMDEYDAEVQKYENSEDGSKRYELWFFVDSDPSPVFSAPSLRAAIDAARKEAQP